MLSIQFIMMKKILLFLTVLLSYNLSAQSLELELAADVNQDGSNQFLFSSNPNSYTVFNNKMYFVAGTTKKGIELISYDGTNFETIDIYAGKSSSRPRYLTVANNHLYFLANDGSNADTASLFKYDGVNSPVAVTSVNLPISQTNNLLTGSYNGGLIYTTFNLATTERIIWFTDGTSAPTQIGDITSNPNFTELNGDLYYLSNSRLMRWDGTNNPTQITNNFISIISMVKYGNSIYLSLFDGSGSLGQELYSYDGTNTPTLVQDINPNTGQSSSPNLFTVANNKLYFRASDGTNGTELWVYDGATASMVYDVNPAAGSSNPYGVVYHNSNLYYIADNGTDGYRMYEYSGSGTPTIIPSSANITVSNFFVFQSKLLCSASDGVVGSELFSFDGTNFNLEANLVKGSLGSTIRQMITYKNKLYFNAYNDVGDELYSFDGSSVSLVADLYPGVNANPNSSQPRNFVVYNDKLYFIAQDSTGYKIWQYDGVNAPTIALNRSGSSFTEFNNKLYFNSADSLGNELYSFDGTTASIVADINPGAANSYPGGYYEYNNKLYFSANNGVDGVELWVYDGTNPPSLAYDIDPIGSSGVNDFAEFDGKLYFRARPDSATGFELMVFDGTSAPTLAADINQGVQPNGLGNNSSPQSLTVLNNKLHFLATDSTGRQLFEYDGVNAPERITEYTPVSNTFQFAQGLFNINGHIYFWADEGSNLGVELYRYDGTSAPVMFNELAEGISSTYPLNGSNMVAYDGYIYTSAFDDSSAIIGSGELYRFETCSVNNTVTLNGSTLTVSETGATYQWVDCDNNNTPITGETNASFTPTVTGNYACIISKDGCDKISDCNNVVINSITSELVNNAIMIYPNPATDMLYVKTELEIRGVYIYNAIGEQVVSQSTANISVDHLNRGVYFIQVNTDAGVVNKSIILQ